MPNSTCVFCSGVQSRVVLANELAFAIYDGFPVTPGHTLIIPKRHVGEYFDLTRDELLACDELLRALHDKIMAEDSQVQGFNLGVNAGAVAGQTIFHCHIHLIPRRAGDVSEPRGGVRHVIPGKGYY